MLSGDPTVTNKLEHRPTKITPDDAYLSDNQRTTPAPKSDDIPQGREIERATTKDGLKSASGNEPVYVRPVRDTRPGQTSLYINNTPTSDDVAQTGLGDCYYLAVLSTIVDRDPERIRLVMPDPGTTGPVTATFYFKDSENVFHPQPVTINQDLVYKVSTDKLLGNRFKVQPTNETGWVLKQEDGSKQFIEEEHYYQTALWAPLLEKAFARFAEVHDISGFAFSAQGNGPGDYENIGKGGNLVHHLYELFYGDQAQIATTIPVNSVERTKHLLNPNDPYYVSLIQALLRFEDRGKHLKKSNQLQLMTASANASIIMGRVVRRLERLKESDYQQFNAKCQALLPVQVSITKDKLKELLSTTQTLEEDNPKVIQAQSSARWYLEALLDYINEGLEGKTPSTTVRHLVQQLLDLLGGEATLNPDQKRRYIYTKHAYAILKVHLVNTNGRTIRVDPSDLEAVKAVMPTINRLESMVTLRNPHHANSPDFYGQRDYQDAGLFTLKLSKFLRNFTQVTSGVVQKK
jgi:hypothetical protein